MPNTHGLAYSFLVDLLLARQAFGATNVRATTAADSFKAALYSTAATIGPSTTAYTASGEVSGAGYTAGGAALTFGTAPALDGVHAIVTPSTSLLFTGVTIGPTDCALVYNDTLAGKNAVGAATFGAVTIVAGNFLLTMPTNAAGTALIDLEAVP